MATYSSGALDPDPGVRTKFGSNTFENPATSIFQNQNPDTTKMQNTSNPGSGSVTLVYTIVDSVFLFCALVNGILLFVSSSQLDICLTDKRQHLL